MRKQNLCLLPIMFLALLNSCSDDDSVSEVYEEVNGTIKEKRIKSITLIATNGEIESGAISHQYNSTKQLTSISDGETAKSFIYGNNDEIETISGIVDDGFSFSTLYETRIQGFKFGDFIDYDENSNPKTVVTLQENYNSNTDSYSYDPNGTASISYDNQPNLYFYTFDAAGLYMR